MVIQFRTSERIVAIEALAFEYLPRDCSARVEVADKVITYLTVDPTTIKINGEPLKVD